MLQKILVPTDGSELSYKAMHMAIEAAKKINGSIVGLSVSEPYPLSPLSEAGVSGEAAIYENRSAEIARDNVNKIQTAAKEANVPCEVKIAKSFDPYVEIIKAAKETHCDTIFIAPRSRKGIGQFMLGSQTQKVLAHSDIPVLICK